MRRLKVGIVGAGRFADKAIFPALKQIEGIQVAAVYSRSEERAREVAAAHNVPLSFADFGRFCHEAGLDCALVLTPPEAHLWAVKNLLEAGIDVFCEKPLSPSLSEIEEMVGLADENKRVFMVGFNRRFAPMFVSAKEAFINSGVDLCVAGKFKNKQDERGLLNDGIHLVDAMRWLCGGDFVDVEAHAAYSDPHMEKTLVAHVRFDTGALGVFTMSRSAGQWMEIVELHGGGQSARIDFPNTLELITETGTEVSDFKSKDWAWAIDVPRKGGFAQELEHFFECVRERKEPLTSGRDASKTHRLVNEIYRCAGLPLLEHVINTARGRDVGKP